MALAYMMIRRAMERTGRNWITMYVTMRTDAVCTLQDVYLSAI